MSESAKIVEEENKLSGWSGMYNVGGLPVYGESALTSTKYVPISVGICMICTY